MNDHWSILYHLYLGNVAHRQSFQLGLLFVPSFHSASYHHTLIDAGVNMQE